MNKNLLLIFLTTISICQIKAQSTDEKIITKKENITIIKTSEDVAGNIGNLPIDRKLELANTEAIPPRTEKVHTKLSKCLKDSEATIAKSEDVVQACRERIKKAKEKLEQQKKMGTISDEAFEKKRKNIEEAEANVNTLEESAKYGKAKLEIAKKKN